MVVAAMRAASAIWIVILSIGMSATAVCAQDYPNTGIDAANSAGAPAWRGMPVLPPGSPSEKECAKHGCIYIVNLSDHPVTALRYAMDAGKNGKVKWSGNQFGPSFAFLPNRWMRWVKPDGLSCSLSLSVDVRVGGKRVEEHGAFDTCANPLLLFYIYDPDGKRGTVTVDPIPDAGKSTAPPKP